MGKKIGSVTVVFTRDIPESLVEETMNAIRMIKNVQDVKANVSNEAQFTAEVRVRNNVVNSIYEMLQKRRDEA